MTSVILTLPEDLKKQHAQTVPSLRIHFEHACKQGKIICTGIISKKHLWQRKINRKEASNNKLKIHYLFSKTRKTK